MFVTIKTVVECLANILVNICDLEQTLMKNQHSLASQKTHKPLSERYRL